MKIKSIAGAVLLSGILIASISVLSFRDSYAHRYHDHDNDKEAPQMHTEVPFRPSTMEELARFHGHLGPFVVLGSHMGEYAVTEYGMPRYFGVSVEVECPAVPPHACLIDGLMVSTGATYGKKNIHHTHAKEIRVIITDDATGASAAFSLKPSTLAMLEQWEKDDLPIPERGEKCFAMKSQDLFDVEYAPADSNESGQ
ncbi:MAG: formylmethanofuran dehydrogenase subunit E family protein [Candidatus Omnitrophica bacterium]|nr:formylmethanofuran dehydrogenase subunit E family protein [Candidatus Omnitrophota bacterium]